MKTMEELYNEIKADKKLQDEAIAAAKADKIADFLKAHDCNATVEEVIPFAKAKLEKAGLGYLLEFL